MAHVNRYLMCEPIYYDVSYVINPWMEKNLHRASAEASLLQWGQLRELIGKQAKVELIAPRPGHPDLIFTANAGLVLEDKFVLSRFQYEERQGEEKYFQEWFEEQRYKVYKLPPELPFEGAGDALLDQGQDLCWAGYGFRSSIESHPYLQKWLEIEIVSLRLIDKNFYHLDTCFCPLEDGYLLYYPEAFDEKSRRLIARRVPEEKLLAVTDEDALNFACNAVNLKNTVILNKATPKLIKRLADVGLQVVQTDLSEFIKAGGAAKCLTLRLIEARPSSRIAVRAIPETDR